MDVREVGWQMLWMRVLYRTNYKKHIQMTHALNEFIKKVKKMDVDEAKRKLEGL